jgi:N-sulfoglucosamine sulfohydrolase
MLRSGKRSNGSQSWLTGNTLYHSRTRPGASIFAWKNDLQASLPAHRSARLLMGKAKLKVVSPRLIKHDSGVIMKMTSQIHGFGCSLLFCFRRVLRLSCFLVLASWCAGLSTAAQTASRPNILFCFADDWGRYASAYAALDDRPSVNQVVRTPNIDRVAREGVLFKNAFVTSPSCTPCRSSLLSGQYFWRTGRGAILLNARWDASIPSYPLLLRDSGYHIGKSYKVWSPGLPVDAPYGGQEYAYQSAGGEFNNFSQNATRMVREGMTFEQAKARMLGQVRQNFADFLAARKPGQPFCFWFGPTLTHRTFEKDSGKALWGIDPDSLKGRMPKFLPDVPEVRGDFADYLGEVQAWDESVGVLLEELRKAGELDKTLVVISGDHGMPGVPGGKCNLYDFGVGVALLAKGPGIKGGRVVDDFVNLMDLAPTFLEFGEVKPPAVMTGRSLARLLRSEKSGQVEPDRTWVVTGRERHLDSARPGNLPYPHRAFRTKDYLYIRNFAPDRWPMGAPGFVSDADAPSVVEVGKNTRAAFGDMDASPTKAWLFDRRNEPRWKWHYDYAFGKRPAEELYDLRKDPDQVKNCADDPEYATIRRDLSERLMKVLRETEDPRVTGDRMTFERPPFTEIDTERAAGRKQKNKGKN